MGSGQRRRPATETASAAPAASVTPPGVDPQQTMGNAAIAEQMNAGAATGEQEEESAAPEAEAADTRVTMNVTVSDTTWNAAGSLESIADEVEARQAGAHVRWNPSYSVTLDGIYVTAVTVNVPITKEMPVWAGRADASTADQAEWDRFLAALEVHEQGHIDIARRGLQGVGDRMIDSPEDMARQTFNNGVQSVQSQSDTYDASNGHGRTQGAVLTPPGNADS